MEKKLTSSSEVSLVEIILSVFIFAITGAIMLNCFASARFTQIRAYDKTIAAMKVQTEIEYVRSTNSLKELESALNERYGDAVMLDSGDKYRLYYDNKWNFSDKDNGIYILTLTMKDVEAVSGVMKDIEVKIERGKPYPFGKKESYDIFNVNSKKYYPDF